MMDEPSGSTERALTRLAQALALGPEYGKPNLWDLVTPATAGRLNWWFGEGSREASASRFHIGQQRALLACILAHEVATRTEPLDEAAPRLRSAVTSLGQGIRLDLLATAGSARVVYGLLAWQWLNWAQGGRQGREDPRFAARILLLAASPGRAERWLDALLGPVDSAGGVDRNASASSLTRDAALLLPPQWRADFLDFITRHVLDGNVQAVDVSDRPWVVVASRVWWLAADPAAGDAAQVRSEAGRIGDDERRRVLLAAMERAPGLVLIQDVSEPESGGEDGAVLEAGESPLARLDLAADRPGRILRVDMAALPAPCVPAGITRVSFAWHDAVIAGRARWPILDLMTEPDGAAPEVDGGLAASEHAALVTHGLHRLRQLSAEWLRIDPSLAPCLLIACETTALVSRAICLLRACGWPDSRVERAGAAAVSCSRADGTASPNESRVVITLAAARPQPLFADIVVAVLLRSASTSTAAPERFVAGALAPMRVTCAAIGRLRRELRAQQRRGETPEHLVDALLLIEHPRFRVLYPASTPLFRHPAERGLTDRVTGDLVRMRLREAHERFDLVVPIPTAAAGPLSPSYRLSGMSAPLIQNRHAYTTRKCVWTRMPTSSCRCGILRHWLERAEHDDLIEAVCLVNDGDGDLPHCGPLLGPGSLRSGCPDLLVRTAGEVFIVTVCACSRDPAVAALRSEGLRSWCEQVNALPTWQRGHRHWFACRLPPGRLRQWHGDRRDLAGYLRDACGIAGIGQPIDDLVRLRQRCGRRVGGS